MKTKNVLSGVKSNVKKLPSLKFKKETWGIPHHTPTPKWHSVRPNSRWIQGDYDGQEVFTDESKGKSVARFVKSEDAAYAIRAVNAHEEMLEVLKKIREHLKGNNALSRDALLGDSDDTISWEISQAIAKAEGK